MASWSELTAFSAFLADQVYSTNIWRTLSIVLVLTNLKNIPLMWHARLISSVLYHIRFRKDQVITASKNGGQAIFQSIVTTSRSPLYECDINGHKSDSTYFTDLDINRIHLISLLFKGASNPALVPRSSRRENGATATPKAKPAKMRVLLGGTSCTFRKEIKPYASYEIHSRVLSWDDKWIYIISHFVPTGSLMKAVRQQKNDTSAGDEKTSGSGNPPVIFASAISKYVFKDGRKTVAPEEALEMLGLLPERSDAGAEGVKAAKGNGFALGHWTRSQVEEENARGMEIAQHFIALDNLHELFSSDTAARTFGKFGVLGGTLC